jgi:hypothetical protein
LVHVKKLADCCRRAGIAETRRLALPLLPRIFADPEFVIRQALADELAPICAFLRESDDLPQPPAVTENGDGSPVAAAEPLPAARIVESGRGAG